MARTEIFIPIRPPSGGKSQARQAFIKESRPYIPNIYNYELFPFTERKYSIYICFMYINDQIIDIDNSIKTILDSLKGRIIRDDRDVKRLIVEVKEHHFEQGIIVQIEEM